MKSYSGVFLLCAFGLSSTSVWCQTQKPAAPKTPAMQTGILLVRSDKAASLLIDGKGAGDLEAGGFLKVSAVAGEHFLEAREKGVECKWEKKVTIPAGTQVAEEVDFAAACPPNPAAGSPAPSPAIVAPPPIVARTAVVDPKIQEARELHDRGCLLTFMQRASEAVTFLEKAASLMPETDDRCLDLARRMKKGAQEKLTACENSQIPSAPDKKGSASAMKPNCRADRGSFGIVVGDFEGGTGAVNSDLSLMQIPGVHPSPSFAALLYRQRAQYDDALGNRMAALRDLQTALDWSQREPKADDGWIYFYRAAILEGMGNLQGAVEDCRAFLTFTMAAYDYPQEYCKKWIADNPSSPNAGPVALATQPHAMPPAQTTQPTISQEIQAVTGGAYAPLPPIQSSGVRSRNGIGTFEVKNDTVYTLTVLFSGPSENRVEVAPNGSISTTLPSGRYKIVGRVNAPNVMPAYGEYDFDATIAGLEFYIR
jgi:hypothetical protein